MHLKYFEQFNFYFAKPINEILANINVNHVILFKDFLFLDDESEYLKRFYKRQEVSSRLGMLTEFYDKFKKFSRPNLFITDCSKIMQKFYKRQDKLDESNNMEIKKY